MQQYRKSAEERLHIVEKRYSLATRAAKVGVWDWNLLSGDLYLDDSLKESLGYDVDEVGNSFEEWMQLIHPEDLFSVRDAFEAHLAGRTPQLVAEYRRKHKDGTARWVFTRGGIVYDDEGKAVRFVGTDIDITERKRVEQALVRTEQNYRSIFENSLEGIVQTTAEGRFIRMNPTMASMLGYDSPRQAVVEITDIETQVYVDGSRRQELLTALERDGEVKDFVFQWKKRDGDVFWASANSRAIRDASGAIYYIESFVQDITEKLHAEEALRASEKKYRTVIETIPVIVWSVDTDGRFTLFEGQGVDALMLEDSVLGKTVQEVFPDVPALDDMTHKVLAGESHQTTIPCRGFILSTTSSPLRDARNNVVGTIAVAMDVSEQVIAEQNMRRTEKMEALGILAGGIAHDFNNVLTAVVNLTTLADMQVDKKSKTHEDLMQVLASAERGRDIVRQILTFSKQGREEKRYIQPAEIIQGDLQFLCAALPDSVEFELDVRSTLGSIHMDPSQMHQLLLNLCTNAADAMGEDGGTLTIRLDSCVVGEEGCPKHLHLESGEYFVLSIGDTGTGVDPDLREKVFTPFFTTKPTGKGTGMGLAVVHGIVRRSKGAVDIEDREGGGTWFHIYLPGHEMQVPETVQEKLKELSEHAGVLFVDDEDVVAKSGGEILRSYGFDVVACKDADEALLELKRDPYRFDMLITDMIMPKTTGKELAKAAMQIRPDLPVVMCSGYSEPDAEPDLANVKEFLHKPVDWNALANTVISILQEKKDNSVGTHG